MKKLLSFIVVLFIGSTAMMAQTTYVDNGGVQSKLNQKLDLKRNTFHFDVGIGNAVDVGLHMQHNFNRYLSWDMISLRYARHFSAKNNEFIATTGVRAYTPAFGKSKAQKVYLAVGLGYGGYDTDVKENNPYYYNNKYYSYYEDKTEWQSSFTVECELGIYLSHCFYLGAHATFLDVLKKDNSWSYMLRLGYEF